MLDFGIEEDMGKPLWTSIDSSDRQTLVLKRTSCSSTQRLFSTDCWTTLHCMYLWTGNCPLSMWHQLSPSSCQLLSSPIKHDIPLYDALWVFGLWSHMLTEQVVEMHGSKLLWPGSTMPPRPIETGNLGDLQARYCTGTLAFVITLSSLYHCIHRHHQRWWSVLFSQIKRYKFICCLFNLMMMTRHGLWTAFSWCQGLQQSLLLMVRIVLTWINLRVPWLLLTLDLQHSLVPWSKNHMSIYDNCW